MSSVTFPTNIGGDGSTVDDTSNPDTGLGNGGHRKRFIPSLTQFINICNWIFAAVTAALADAQAAAATAISAPGSFATSATTINLATATVGSNVTITLDQTGKLFGKSQSVVIGDDADPTKNIIMLITAFNATTKIMTGKVAYSSGSSGSITTSNVALTAAVDTSLTGRMATAEAAIKKNRYRRLLIDGKI